MQQHSISRIVMTLLCLLASACDEEGRPPTFATIANTTLRSASTRSCALRFEWAKMTRAESFRSAPSRASTTVIVRAGTTRADTAPAAFIRSASSVIAKAIARDGERFMQQNSAHSMCELLFHALQFQHCAWGSVSKLENSVDGLARYRKIQARAKRQISATTGSRAVTVTLVA
jgi:hypothetical protein